MYYNMYSSDGRQQLFVLQSIEPSGCSNDRFCITVNLTQNKNKNSFCIKIFSYYMHILCVKIAVVFIKITRLNGVIPCFSIDALFFFYIWTFQISYFQFSPNRLLVGGGQKNIIFSRTDRTVPRGDDDRLHKYLDIILLYRIRNILCLNNFRGGFRP